MRILLSAPAQLRVHRDPGQTDEEFSALLQQYFAKRHEEALQERAEWQARQQQRQEEDQNLVTPGSSEAKRSQQRRKSREPEPGVDTGAETDLGNSPPETLSFSPPDSLPQQQARLGPGVWEPVDGDSRGEGAEGDESPAPPFEEEDLLGRDGDHPLAPRGVLEKRLWLQQSSRPRRSNSGNSDERRGGGGGGGGRAARDLTSSGTGAAPDEGRESARTSSTRASG